jgi:predicted DNA-binding transcriptional regulator YafY
MNHLSRLLSILTILKSKRIVTAPELARRFDISVRTIYRDINKLEASGVPIMTVEGRGYAIMDGYVVAPIMFDEMEVNALITAENLIAKTNDDSLIKHFDLALEKIKSVLKSPLLSKGALLNSKMLVLRNKTEEGKSASLSYIQSAITNFRLIEINYQAPEKETIRRKIEPLAIYWTDERWVVVAWCHLRQDYRSFRLDRIKHFRMLEEKFKDRNFDLSGYFATCFQVDHRP